MHFVEIAVYGMSAVALGYAWARGTLGRYHAPVTTQSPELDRFEAAFHANRKAR